MTRIQPPWNCWPHLLKANALGLLKDFDGAELSLSLARRDSQQDAIALAFHAIVFARLNSSEDEIAAAWQEVLEYANSDPVPWILAGRYYTEVGNESRADQYLNRAAALCPGNLDQFIQAGLWVAGPYSGDLDSYRPPQLSDSPSSRISASNDTTGWSMLDPPWPTAPAWNHDEFSPEFALEANRGSAYLMTYIYSPDNRTEMLRLSPRFSNKGVGVRVWMNRRLVYRTNEKLGTDVNAEAIPISLNKGKNVLLLRANLESESNDFSLKVSLADSPTNRAIALAELRRWSEAAIESKEHRKAWESWIGHDDFARACQLSLFGEGDGIVGQYGDELAMTAINAPDAFRSPTQLPSLPTRRGLWRQTPTPLG
ncbi:MAG: hypothetical protein ABI557_15745 [Aureliella sp.]